MDATSMFYGTERATITADRILARPFQEKKQLTASFMQSAFDLYYQAHEAARQIGWQIDSRKLNLEAQRKIVDLRSKMEKDILAAADKWHQSDLKWCFKHLAKNKGFWKDDSWNGWKGICNLPVGVHDFLSTVEERGRKVIDSYAEWQHYQANLRQLAQAKQWEKLGPQLDMAGKVLDKVTPQIWVALGASKETAASRGGLVCKWVGFAGIVHNCLSTYLKVRYHESGAERAALAEAAALVVQGLPIFGQLYADVIRGIPNLMRFFENYGARTRQAIEMVGR